MVGIVELLLGWLGSLLKSRQRLQSENLILRHQLNILRRRIRGSVRLSNPDRLVLVGLYRLCPSVVNAVAIIRPETLVRWASLRIQGVLALEVVLQGGPADGT